MSRNVLLVSLVGLAGCGVDALGGYVDPLTDLAGGSDAGAPPDLAGGPFFDLPPLILDLSPGPPDLTVLRDFTVIPPDMAQLTDFSVIDLAMRDMVVIPDLTPPPDLIGSYPAAHRPLPQIQFGGGARLRNPRIYNVTFAGDGIAASLDAFVAALPASAWWQAVMTDYQIGAGTVAPAVHLAEMAMQNITDGQIQQWLAGKLDGTHPEFGVPDGNSLYVLQYPPGTSISFQGNLSCQQFGGYHWSTTLVNGQNVSYAVIARCPPDALHPGLSVLNVATYVSSHEIAEAASDATPRIRPAYATVDFSNQGWELSAGGENGDLCVLLPGSVIFPNDLPNAAQRIWSNSAARVDQDPCVPAAQGQTYFNAAPVFTQQIADPFSGTRPPGILEQIGQSTTIEVDLYSTAPTQPWTVSAVDLYSIGGGPAFLTFTWDKTTGVNGDKLHLTVTAKRQGPMGYEPFLIRSTLNGYVTQWQGAVSQQ